jgi:uncharacterized protein YggU (UPF0235/DUF167 family)
VADAVLLTVASGGVRLRLRVKPGGRDDRLIGAYGESLKLEVRAAPERGRANAAVAGLLARSLGVPEHAFRIVSGATGQDKTVEIVGVALDAIIAALADNGIPAVVA